MNKNKEIEVGVCFKSYGFNLSVFFVLLCVFFYGCKNHKEESFTQNEHPNITKLKKQSSEFVPEIIKLNEKVYVAVGYDGSNTSMVIGEKGVVIVDALRSLGAAEKVWSEFRKLTDKPVVGLIYTHGHQDHTGGASAFIDDVEDVEIIARKDFKKELEEHSPVKKILKQRNIRQFGRDLPLKDIINRGVAAGVTPTDRVGKGYVKPTIVFEDSLKVNLGGLEFNLYAANGETNDHLFVWCQDVSTLFTGDNYYKAFPNLYAIRGSRYRDVKSWGKSLEKMSVFPTEYLVPGHTRPLFGKKKIKESLKDYSSAILSVYNQTIDAMNKGYTLQETVDVVTLPDSLVNKDNLQEFYGSVAWGVRSIFSYYVGWFDGNPTNLQPLSSVQEAKYFIELAGGEKQMLSHLQKALNKGDYQWGLKLADQLLQVEYNKNEVLVLKIQLLKKIADKQINAPARNYYLSYAYELENKKE